VSHSLLALYLLKKYFAASVLRGRTTSVRPEAGRVNGFEKLSKAYRELN
jgi:hypothetical protein